MRAGVREPARLATALLLCAAVLGCAFSRSLPPSMTCEDIRALEIGMTAERVRGLLGPPRALSPFTECGDGVRQHGQCWSYESAEDGIGGIRFRLEIDRDEGLRRAIVYYKYLLSERATTLFELTAAGRVDTPELSSYVPCRSGG